MLKKYIYESFDGTHFPDADKGDDLFYAIDITPWLAVENDTLISVVWEYPKPVKSSEHFMVGNEATIKLKADVIGTYKIKCKITTSEQGKEQLNVIPMMLKVV